jgi:hypothetical protein
MVRCGGGLGVYIDNGGGAAKGRSCHDGEMEEDGDVHDGVWTDWTKM